MNDIDGYSYVNGNHYDEEEDISISWTPFCSWPNISMMQALYEYEINPRWIDGGNLIDSLLPCLVD
jgi:hypothetical protein